MRRISHPPNLMALSSENQEALFGGWGLTSPEANRWLRLVQSVVTFDYRILDVNFEKKLLYNGTIPVVVAVRLLLMLLYEINIFQLLAFQLHGILYLSCWKSRNSLKYEN